MNLKPLFLGFIMMGFAGFSQAQEWEKITDKLFAEGENPEFAEDAFNRKLGALVVMPKSGDLLLVRNGLHPIYRSRNQGKSWKPLKGGETKGRAYGSYSISIDYSTSRMAIFTIVQKKHTEAHGLMLSAKGKVLTTIQKPNLDHDGWTWGMPAWEQENPRVILGKEHHKWVVMWLSTDGGQNWQKLDFKSRNPGVIDSQTFVAGNNDGIYRSTDQGQNWEKVADFVTTGKNPIRYGDHFYWATEKGIIWTQDQGKSWQLLGSPLPSALWGPFFGNSEQSLMVVNSEGFHISYDHGQQWEKVASYFAPPTSNLEGKYDVTHPTNSYGWDQKRGIIYAAGLGADAYKLVLNK